MKKKKLNFLVIIGMIVAFGTMSFEFIERQNLAEVWFATDENGTIEANNPLSSRPLSCSSGLAYCAVSFDSADLLPGNQAPIGHVEADQDNLIKETAYMPKSN